jgi:hypothetical protein
MGNIGGAASTCKGARRKLRESVLAGSGYTDGSACVSTSTKRPDLKKALRRIEVSARTGVLFNGSVHYFDFQASNNFGNLLSKLNPMQ